MKTTAIFSAALLGASVLSYGAVAQTASEPTMVPGSESQLENQNAETRDDVAATPGMTSAETVSPESQTLVPGSESQRENLRAEERDSIAEGEDAMATGAVTTNEAGESDVLVPGSGATFSPSDAPKTQSGEALQDESPASQTQ
ncbi:MAG: hypothetical protein CMP81_19295 [Fulvimarina sp.]|nr:hypothetical protein [Fulvimarina sp.]